MNISLLYSKKPLALLGILVVVLLCSFVLFFQKSVSPQKIENQEVVFAGTERQLEYLQNIDYQNFFEKNIHIFFKHEGINGMVQRVIKALATGQIDMFACHSLAHDIGHYAGYPEYFGDINQYATKENLDFCGSGFLHGVEGQLANNEYPQSINDLYNFCKIAMPLHPYYNGCYHGAGHSFMQNTKNPTEALAQCDLLKVDESITVKDCYRGVFSEHVNYVISQGKGYSYLLDYCNSLSAVVQANCAQELHGLGLSPETNQAEIEEAFKKCTDKKYSQIIQENCVSSVAEVAVDRLVGQGKDVTPPEVVTLFNDKFFTAYIEATIGSFLKTKSINPAKTMNNFCELFHKQSQKDLCVQKVLG